jgi:hypothetical protein
MKRLIFTALFVSCSTQTSQQTVTIQPHLMPQVIAYVQKQGKLPSGEELAAMQQQATNTNEQAKFANAVGTCVTGITTTLMTGNPLPVLSAIFGAVAPLISRSQLNLEIEALQETPYPLIIIFNLA